MPSTWAILPSFIFLSRQNNNRATIVRARDISGNLQCGIIKRVGNPSSSRKFKSRSTPIGRMKLP
jgi:hypothetical protein